ncbi:organic solute transporter subunit alpha-like isoform X2 [Clavelina lepadiformis]|uniref:organic solute transporter subunit alpha-like isoform X2 n=1 Tax=Clavelina lepadiformis TaxID=159417 RepID=UPI004040FCC2
MENTTMMESSTESTIFTWTCDPRSQSSSAADLLRMINASGIGMQVQMYFPIALVVVMVIIFIEEVVFHVKNSSHWRRTIYTLWVLGVFPSLSFLSLLAIFIPRASAVIDFAAGFYYAIVLKKFFMLIIHLYGGKQQMENALKGDRVVSANPFPCCFVCCCHNQPMSLRRINILQSLVYQVVIIYPVCYFIQTVISAEGLLQDPATARAASFGMTLVGGILTISSFVCLYGFRVLSFASGYSLQQFHIRTKILPVQLVVATKSIQEFVLGVTQRFGSLGCGFPYPDRQKDFLLHNYLFIYELFVLAFISWFTFRRLEEGCEVIIRPLPSEIYSVNTGNMTEAINVGEQNGGMTYDDQDSNVYEKVEIKSDLTYCKDKAIETV